MNSTLMRKDGTLLVREPAMKLLLSAIAVLVLAGLAAGLLRIQVFEKERIAAQETDRDVWLSQGERNPHSAAHFSRYAFRSTAPLAVIDPGVSDFAGVAVWMEAHFQDPAEFRRAEDGGELGRFAWLSPAFLLVLAGPLLVLVILHGAVAGEREDNTLRQLLATGVNWRDFFWSKLSAGLRASLIVLLLLFAALAAIALLAVPSSFTADTLVRLLAMFVAYCLYITAFVAFAIGISALLRSRQHAFLALIGAWALLVVLVPRFVADLGVALHPQPDSQTVSARLREASDAFWTDPTQAEARVLAEFGVDDVAELPFFYSGYQLQYSEELSNPLFDAVYQDLDAVHVRQERVMNFAALLSPAISMSRLSAGFAATDREHQRHFTHQAEQHRRQIIKQLNEDYMYNAREAGRDYTGDEALWAQIEDFEFAPPTLGMVANRYVSSFGQLLLWAVAAIGFAYWSTSRAVSREVYAQ